MFRVAAVLTLAAGGIDPVGAGPHAGTAWGRLSRNEEAPLSRGFS